MSKTVWFINDYAGSSYHGMEFRNYYFAKELVKLGYTVYIVTASYMHLFKHLPKTKGQFTYEKIDGINYVWVKVPHYKSSHDKKRVLKWFVFTTKLFALPFQKMKKPDVIVASPMATFLVFPSYLLAKKYNAKFIYEVKDIWPLSLVELGGFNPKHPIIALMRFFEKFALKRADKIVSSLQNYGEHIEKDLGLERDFEWICNGVDLDELSQIEPLEKTVFNQIPKDKFIVGYTGTVGVANSLETFCQAAKSLQNRPEIFFVIVGDGQEKERLVETYGKLDNILFIQSIPKRQVQSMLALFDVCYIGLRKEKLFRYGVSPNKLFDYMYSEKPIIYAIDSGKNNIVKVAKCGLSIESQNSKAIKSAVEKLFELDNEFLITMGKNAKRYVLEQFSYDKLTLKLHNIMEI